MKIKIALLIYLGLISSLNVKAQKINLDERISIVLPSNSQKMSDASVVNAAKQKNIKLNEISENKNRQFYLSDDVIVTLVTTTKVKNLDLNKLRNSLIEMSPNTKRESLRIINKNENQYLIAEDNSKPKITFFAVNSSNDKLVSGVLDFKEMSRAKANSLLDTIFSTMNFQK